MTQPPYLPGFPAQPPAQPGGFPGQAPPQAPGYPPQAAPPQAAPPQAAPPQAPGYPPQAGGVPGMPAVSTAALGAAIAGATLGVQRLPQLTPGDYLLDIELTTKPARSMALLAEMTVIESTAPDRPPGTRVSWYQDLSGQTPNQAAAQQAGALAFILRATGFETLDDMRAAGWTDAHLAAHVDACFASPGPLVHRRVHCTVFDSGKRAKKTGVMICNQNWSPAV